MPGPTARWLGGGIVLPQQVCCQRLLQSCLYSRNLWILGAGLSHPATHVGVSRMRTNYTRYKGGGFDCLFLADLSFFFCAYPASWGTLSPEFDPTHNWHNRHSHGSIRDRLKAQGVHEQLASGGCSDTNVTAGTGSFHPVVGGHASGASAKRDAPEDNSRSHENPPKHDPAGTSKRNSAGDDDEDEEEDANEHEINPQDADATQATCARWVGWLKL